MPDFYARNVDRRSNVLAAKGVETEDVTQTKTISDPAA